jgi:hypothetical protein
MTASCIGFNAFQRNERGEAYFCDNCHILLGTHPPGPVRRSTAIERSDAFHGVNLDNDYVAFFGQALSCEVLHVLQVRRGSAGCNNHLRISRVVIYS